MPAVGALGVGAIEALRGGQRRPQLRSICDRGERFAAADRDARRHRAQPRDRVADDRSVARELVEHRLGQHENVAGCSGKEPLPNCADGAERAVDVGAGRRAKRRLQRLDEALRGTRAQQLDVHG
jgi:hypothetical protein